MSLVILDMASLPNTSDTVPFPTLTRTSQLPLRKRRRGGKTYSGCGICRIRKIKCDGRQPSCANCERSRRYLCDGFDKDGPRDEQSQRRRSAKASTSICQSESEETGSGITRRNRNSQVSHESRSPGAIEHQDPQSDPAVTHSPSRTSTSESDPSRFHDINSTILSYQNEPWHQPCSEPQQSHAQNFISPGYPDFASIVGSVSSDGFNDNFGSLSYPTDESTGGIPFVTTAEDLPLAHDLFPTPFDAFSSVASLGNNYTQSTNQEVPLFIKNNNRDEDDLSRNHDQSNVIALRQPQRDSYHQYQETHLAPLMPTRIVDHSYGIPDDILQELVHHYSTYTSGLMMPTLAPSRNPWLRVYLPMALQNPPSPATECLLYGVLACSAFNKAELGCPGRATYLQKARFYKQRSTNLLSNCVSSVISNDGSQDPLETQTLLTAALTLPSIDVFSGAGEGWGYESLVRAKEVINRVGSKSRWPTEMTTMNLLQIFYCLEIISCTSAQGRGPSSQRRQISNSNPARMLLEANERDHDGQFEQTQIDDDSDTPRLRVKTVSRPFSTDNRNLSYKLPANFKYPLNVTFGVALRTLRCLGKIVELAQKKEAFSNTDGSAGYWSDDDIDALVSLEANIFGAFDDLESLVPPQQLQHSTVGGGPAGPTSSDLVTQEITENHMKAFHYSVAVFYRRALCDGGTDVVPNIDLITSTNTSATFQGSLSNRYSSQYLVSKALEHLENVDALSNDMIIANTLWAGFVAAVEAKEMPLRHRAMIWLGRARRHGIGNLAKAKEVMMECWRQNDRYTWSTQGDDSVSPTDLGPADWREVMREKGLNIMLT